MKIEKKLISSIIVVGVIATSFFELAPAMALTSVPAFTHTMSVTTMDQYKVDYAAYKIALAAWNVNRNQQIASYMDLRNSYSALLLSNQKARLDISAARIEAVTAANNAYSAAILKTTSAATRKGLLTARNAKIATANDQAKRALAALPVLGSKPLWPAAVARPVKPVKPVTL